MQLSALDQRTALQKAIFQILCFRFTKEKTFQQYYGFSVCDKLPRPECYAKWPLPQRYVPTKCQHATQRAREFQTWRTLNSVHGNFKFSIQVRLTKAKTLTIATTVPLPEFLTSRWYIFRNTLKNLEWNVT